MRLCPVLIVCMLLPARGASRYALPPAYYRPLRRIYGFDQINPLGTAASRLDAISLDLVLGAAVPGVWGLRSEFAGWGISCLEIGYLVLGAGVPNVGVWGTYRCRRRRRRLQRRCGCSSMRSAISPSSAAWSVLLRACIMLRTLWWLFLLVFLRCGRVM